MTLPPNMKIVSFKVKPDNVPLPPVGWIVPVTYRQHTKFSYHCN